MNIFDSLLLGLLQGFTEFLPISSSGHLILAEKLLKLPVETLKSFDIAVHFGTLLAILLFFWRDFWKMLLACKEYLIAVARGTSPVIARKHSDRSNPAVHTHESTQYYALIRYLIIGTIPAVIVGFFFDDLLDKYFRNPFAIAIMFIVVGVFFFVAEYLRMRVKATGLNLKNVIIIGIAQACALMPGVSRSGATISAGLVQGIKREEAAKFSFLLGSVAIAAASALSLYKVSKGEFTFPPADILAVGVLSSFATGYLSIAFLMSFLKKHTLHVFGVYRVIVGFALLYLVLFTKIF